MPHTPTSAQVTKLKALQEEQEAANARLNSAEAAVAAARASLADALTAKQAADDAVVGYQSFIFGPAMEAGIADHVWTIEEVVALLDSNADRVAA